MPLGHASYSPSISAPTTPAPNPSSLGPAFGSFAVNLQPSIHRPSTLASRPPTLAPRPPTLAPPASISRRHSTMPLLAPAPVSFLYFYSGININII